MRQYWQFEYLSDFGKKIRYFYGTEAAVQRRIKRYQGDGKELKNLNRSKAKYLKMENKVNFITL
ncbi:MAG: hypothetical protein GX119_04230 [Syntrophomonadaceae bacterium]|jgi:hypothetical protein|nr:hypothetical protein [Syntrophomonadaceae bacterium]